MSERKIKNKTLSEKISESFGPSSIADPEYDPDETTAVVADIDEFDYDHDAQTSKGLSEIRKRNVKLLSECSDKYKGKISSRKEYEEGTVSNESEEDQVDEENFDDSSVKDSDNDDEDEDLNPSEEKDDSEDDEDDGLEEYREKLKNCQLDSDPDESLGTDDETENNGRTHKPSGSEEQLYDDSDYDSPGENELEGEEEDDESEDEEDESEGDSEEDSKVDEDEEAGPSSGKHFLKETNKTAEIQKGLAVQNQLRIWEKLLEIRIHSQKMLTKANSFPNPSDFEGIQNGSDEFSNLAKETATGVSNLLNNMLEMQKTLYEQYSETKDILRKKCDRKRKSNGREMDTETPCKRIALELEEDFEHFRPYRNSVLQKWYDRTKILTPGGGAKNKAGIENFDILRKIETVLFNKSDLIKKSQTVKGNYKLYDELRSSQDKVNNDSVDHNKESNKDVEESATSSSSPEIYDDMDFYHQQLRELIEFKANMSDNPAEMTKQFAELQKLRKKMKKTVDTRASKGRKVRYVVHNKLVNFMAPQDNSEWTEESKNELYRSLFAT